ncbi:MAG: 2-phosphosulfolactate phosphatase [Synergistales bacterium]|nr:2-phosphosulfolactate phosphatase [Synergistales bacterium]MDY6401213.1 2-phosphosulfolactate phosphatase [Synergistales bacterium]MDY6404447.1 2-phosphosulfolactate phosphatase [Synergistales bacterium]MDY6410194.1 2-phosphosulfolactate phosphatase [Synergistales bacterium]MDY6414946.1 2-phosphosulfolactate phosphatase [Synergistales bacterium]
MFEADLVFSCGENNFLPVADVWLVIDVLRATTVITRWFELGGTELYPVQSPDEARRLVLELRERGSSPLLMGEVNGIPPEGFDLGNSPLELNYELIQEHYCGVMSTTNGTVALNEASSSGSPVIAVSFRNVSACLDHALKIGNRIGILCSGRKNRPSWEDTLCAGAVIESLQARGEVLLTDSARIALTVWKNRENSLLSCVEKSNHAEYLKHIGYGRDIIFACEVDASTVVPMLVNDNIGRIILQSVDGSARPYATPRFERIKPEPVTNTKTSETSDPFEELLSYTKKPPQYFSTQK